MVGAASALDLDTGALAGAMRRRLLGGYFGWVFPRDTRVACAQERDRTVR